VVVPAAVEFPPLAYIAIVIAVSGGGVWPVRMAVHPEVAEFPARPSSAARACIALQNAMCYAQA
jgi:hypothetical protein